MFTAGQPYPPLSVTSSRGDLGRAVDGAALGIFRALSGPVRRACWLFPLVSLPQSSPWRGGRRSMTTSQPTLHPHPSSPEGKSDTQIQSGKRRKWEQREGKSFPVKRKEEG